MNNNIKLYSKEDFEKMQKACDLTSHILDELAYFVKPGISTEDIDKFCSKMIHEAGAKPACLGYRGYPKTVCTSVNSVVCHGIPSEKEILRDGDIINIDVTVIVDGWYGDSSRMFYVGKVQNFAKLLCERTYECLEKAIQIVRPGITLGCIGETIQKCAEGYGYSVVRDYCGHGVGQEFHLPPYVMHHGEANTGEVIKEGMIFTIEPMINIGCKEVDVMKDEWTVLTKDRKLSAQFEHCIGVTSDGCIVFTKSKIGFDKPPYNIKKGG
jgi:methionyl aminopeptidase